MKNSVKRSKGILTALMYVAIYYAVCTLTEIFYVLWQGGSALSLSEIENNLTDSSYSLGVISAIISLWIYIIIGKIRKCPIEKSISCEKTPPITALMAICLAIGARLCVCSYYFFSQNVELLKKSIDDAAALTPRLTGTAELVTALFAVIVAAPLFEEVLFRGLVLGELRRVMRPWAAIFLQALIFGTAHAVLFQTLFAFVMGIVLGIVYTKTKSIFTAALCHGAFNLSVIFTGNSLSTSGAILTAALGLLLAMCSLMYIVLSGKE